MYPRPADYPKAIASADDAGVAAAIRWCREQMHQGDAINVWTHTKANLDHDQALSSFVTRYTDVAHVTQRGGGYLRGRGPVLMAWPDMGDIGELLRSAERVRALCVISWNDNELRPWVTFAEPEILGNESSWEVLTPPIHPVTLEAMKHLTMVINHNNTIAGSGYDKDDVVGILRLLADHGVPFRGTALQGWALANGWARGNPQQLAKYADDINTGKRPRMTTGRVQPSFIDILRRRAENPARHQEDD